MPSALARICSAPEVKTRILRTSNAADRETAVQAAVQALRGGEIVALPTETVYGLAADATDVTAVLKVFAAKERPRFDPLIVHVADQTWLNDVVAPENGITETVLKLTQAFWPGPLTLVLPRNSEINDVVTAGLPTVAVRASAHPIFSEIVRRFGRPIAAPSANRFGHVSPTSAAHVRTELDGLIPLIVDGGPTVHGLESTIVAIREGVIEILRHGPVTAEQLADFAPVQSATETVVPRAPGQLRSHYAPATPLLLTESIGHFSIPHGKRVGALRWREEAAAGFAEIRVLSPVGDPREAAANLFRQLRELDAAKLDLIVAEAVPEDGLGAAIMDRLRRAAAAHDL